MTEAYVTIGICGIIVACVVVFLYRKGIIK